MEIEEGAALADNTCRDLHNSSDDAKGTNGQTSCFSCFKTVPTKHRRYKTSIVKLIVMFTAPALK